MLSAGNADHAAREKIGEAETDSILQGLPLHEHNPAQYYPPVFGVLCEIGSVEISKDASVEALKEMILTLPAVRWGVGWGEEHVEDGGVRDCILQ